MWSPLGKGDMQILTVDIGTGTQDVLLFDSERELENCFKLVLPSPTVVTANRIRAATAARRRLVLQGVTMGGGPSHWATHFIGRPKSKRHSCATAGRSAITSPSSPDRHALSHAADATNGRMSPTADRNARLAAQNP